MKPTIGLHEECMWLIMDNSSVHWSTSVINYLKEKCLVWIYLPQYTPELAPVELFFGMLKRQIAKRRTDTVINLNSEPGRRVLVEELELIDRFTIMKIWMHYLVILKGIVGGIDSILKKVS